MSYDNGFRQAQERYDAQVPDWYDYEDEEDEDETDDEQEDEEE